MIPPPKTSDVLETHQRVPHQHTKIVALPPLVPVQRRLHRRHRPQTRSLLLPPTPFPGPEEGGSRLDLFPIDGGGCGGGSGSGRRRGRGCGDGTTAAHAYGGGVGGGEGGGGGQGGVLFDEGTEARSVGDLGWALCRHDRWWGCVVCVCVLGFFG